MLVFPPATGYLYNNVGKGLKLRPDVMRIYTVPKKDSVLARNSSSTLGGFTRKRKDTVIALYAIPKHPNPLQKKPTSENAFVCRPFCLPTTARHPNKKSSVISSSPSQICGNAGPSPEHGVCTDIHTGISTCTCIHSITNIATFSPWGSRSMIVLECVIELMEVADRLSVSLFSNA